MNTRVAFLNALLRLGTAQVITQLCSFIRTVILARLISPEDFGIAATFLMTYALMEMVSNVSAQTLLVQAPDGDEVSFQATGHLLLVFRGVANAALLLLLAAPMSTLFGVPQARWAFYWLAAMPLARGLMHLDLSRLQRNMQFNPQVAADTIGNILATLLAWPIAAWFPDYSAMLWLSLLQVILYTVSSHIVAERRYAWTWHRDYARRFFSFGWPLLINGVLMYGIFMGDRFVIGASRRLFPHSVYTLTDLGTYSVAFSVTMVPSQACTNVVSSLFLPLLSRAQTVREQFIRRYVVCAHAVSFSALAIAIPFIVAGHWVVPLIYGPAYAATGTFIGWLGAMWGLRIFRAGPTLAAMAFGDTKNAMISNLARTSALAGIVVVAATGGPLVLIAICGFAGEVLAIAVCVARLFAKHQLSPNLSLQPLAVCGTGMLLAALAKAGAIGLTAGIAIAITLLGLCAGTMLLFSPDLRRNWREIRRDSVPAEAAQKATSHTA